MANPNYTFLALLALCGFCSLSSAYKVGVGRTDVTGTHVEINFMFYANIKQVGRGLHTRTFAHDFVMEDDKGNRVVFISGDCGMLGYGLKREVVKRRNILTYKHL